MALITRRGKCRPDFGRRSPPRRTDDEKARKGEEAAQRRSGLDAIAGTGPRALFEVGHGVAARGQTGGAAAPADRPATGGPPRPAGPRYDDRPGRSPPGGRPRRRRFRHGPGRVAGPGRLLPRPPRRPGVGPHGPRGPAGLVRLRPLRQRTAPVLALPHRPAGDAAAVVRDEAAGGGIDLDGLTG